MPYRFWIAWCVFFAVITVLCLWWAVAAWRRAKGLHETMLDMMPEDDGNAADVLPMRPDKGVTNGNNDETDDDSR